MSTAMDDLRRRADARWRANRRKLIAQGRWEPFVEAQPVRDRVWAINRAGMPTVALSERLGLLPTALDHLMWKRDGQYSSEVRTETADAVMGYWPALEDFPARSLIDATGTLRRVAALMTLGWTQRAIAAHMGVPNRSLSRALLKPRVTAELARQLAATYDVLWMRGPDASEVAPDIAQRIRVGAVRQGMHGPLAWDDDTIDDPEATPQMDAAAPIATEGGNVATRWLMGESVILGVAERNEVLVHLYEWTNLTTVEIAEKLEMAPAAAEQAWNRFKRKSLADGRRVWRRVYVPRERNLKQIQMEEAA